MKVNNIIAVVVLVVVVGIGAFFGGTKYQQKKIVSQFSQKTGQNMMARGTGNTAGQTNRQGGFNQTIGEITNIDDSSVTVKTADGSSKIILISESTSFNKSTQVAKTDLKVGTKIVVMGEKNNDGSITGRNIQVDPIIPTLTPTTK